MILLSVFLVSYNQEKYIGEAIESIIGQEDIDLRSLQLVVSDDCSTDQTVEVVESYRSKFPGLLTLNVNSKNLGITKNSNIALSLCRGKYIAFCAGDDVFMPRRLASQLDWFTKNPDGVMCTCGVQVFFDESGIERGPFHDYDCLNNRPIKMVEQFSQLPTVRFMINRSKVPDIICDERTPVVSDWLLVCEMAMRGRVGGVKELGVRYRRHINNTTALGASKSYLDDRLIAIDILFFKYPELYFSCKKQRCYTIYKHAKRLYQEGLFRESMRYAFYSICENKFHIPSYFMFLLPMTGKLGGRVVKILRSIRKSG